MNQRKVDRVLANHSLSSTASQGRSNIPLSFLLLGLSRQARRSVPREAMTEGHGDETERLATSLVHRVLDGHEKHLRDRPNILSYKPQSRTLLTFLHPIFSAHRSFVTPCRSMERMKDRRERVNDTSGVRSDRRAALRFLITSLPRSSRRHPSASEPSAVRLVILPRLPKGMERGRE